MHVFRLIAFTASIAAAAPALADDYASTVAATNPQANFRLTVPNEPSTVGGYATTWSATTTAGPGAPIAADPANTGAVFTPTDANSPGIATGLFGGFNGRGSINLWANLATLPSIAGRTFALAGESQVGNDLDFQIGTDNVLRFYTGAGENTGYQLTNDFAGEWHMLTASYDGTLGSDSYRNIYVDGVRVGSFTGGVNPAAKTSQFVIGYNTVFGGRAFAGSIDEVTAWNYGLSDDQVAAIYASSFDAETGGGVPEPASWAMLIMGFGLVGGAARRRSRGALARA